ncbi:capsule biosynthesis protein [Frigidibacter sp. RF13]|uniref:capsule biosynthesis protein n=1 Tax=Frigidibacter sp. RF13 TaxID=2997340 RepID=UPI00226FF40C|nr:capsule biosynthesis protein [Frigidibacter sp. RF13]MCY1128628.1 capsule biosynthesis protein [Frigidibacter sp. RF13]
MNNPPKATRFRVRRVEAPPAPAPAGAPQSDLPFAPAPEDDGFGGLKLDAGPVAPASPPDMDAALAAIRTEGLSARQLRLARRIALRHGIDATSDEEAVFLLRRKGIDPFQRENILGLVEESAVPSAPAAGSASEKSGGKAVVPAGPMKLPSTQVLSENDRARAIIEMQRDIVRRRRRNFTLLMMRLAFFVLLPTFFAGWYFYKLATPFYATKSEFQIQQSESAGGIGANFLKGTTFANSQDAIAVQGYLQSREAMLRLDESLGYKDHFSQSFVDPLQRLEPGATNEAAYKLYKRNVKIAYDPTEGIVKMEVSAVDPATSQKYSEALLKFAEEQVDNLTHRVREDQMKGARESYADAETKVKEAEQKVLDLQTRLGVLDPKAETTLVMTQVAELEGQLRLKELELSQLLDNAKPNQARVDGVKGDMTRIQGQIDSLRASMTQDENSTLSLAQITGQLRIAETELQTRQLMLSKALEQQESARIEANRQVRYLSVSVAPVAPDEPTYPRAFEDTALAFLVFAGIYLMMSLTASILREQVTA